MSIRKRITKFGNAVQPFSEVGKTDRRFVPPDELMAHVERQEERIKELEANQGKGIQVQLTQMQAALAQPSYVVELYKAGGRGQAMQILSIRSFAGQVKILVAPVDPSRPLPLPGPEDMG